MREPRTMSWQNLAGRGVRYWTSEVESRRFSIPIGRVTVGYDAHSDDVEPQLSAVLAEAGETLLIVRYPATQARLGATIARSGWLVLPADVLTYWEVRADSLAELQAYTDSALRVAPSEASEDAALILETVVCDSFHGYGNHYTADPALDPELALAGYVEWALKAFAADPQNALLLLHDDTPVGAATVVDGPGYLEVELAGLVCEAQGKGWYRMLLRGIGQEALRRGAERVIISTQVSNTRVQRAWAKAGMKPFAAVTTVHATTTS